MGINPLGFLEIFMKFFIFVLSMTTSLAFAGGRQDAYDKVCKNLNFQSNQKSCMEIIKSHTYFDDNALDLCKSLNFDSGKNECLSSIIGKRFEAYEIDSCKGLNFDSRINTCLKENGVAVIDNGGYDNGGYRRCLPLRDVVNQLQAGLQELRSGEVGTVSKRLIYLISNLSAPGCL